MACVFKRATDRARGKAGKWTGCYVDEHGKRRSFVCVTDKAKSIEMAQHRETEAMRVREGVVSPQERTRREASLQTLARTIADYHDRLISRGATAKHADHVAKVITRLFHDASVTSITDISGDRIESALGRMLLAGKSPRTCNHALTSAKSFVRWLDLTDRIREVPRALTAINSFNESVGRKHVRRAATMDEVNRLFAAAETTVILKSKTTGPTRATLYRLAMGTGFRANELRSLRPEWFALNGPEPSVTIPAEFAKNRKAATQPIARALAEMIRPFVEQAERGKPILVVPEKTARMLRSDLRAAGIPYRTADGILDFHSLRVTFISHLVSSGASIKVAQTLARHASPVLTLAVYAKVSSPEVRKALEREAS